MTTVAALARDGHIWMAADTYQAAYGVPAPDTARKIRRYHATYCGPILLGLCGSGALATILDTDLGLVDLDPPDPADPQPWAAQLARRVTDCAKTAAVDNWSAVLGHNGNLWTLIPNQAIPRPDGVAAVGTGGYAALGAIDALLQHSDLPPEKIVLVATEIAIARDTNSRPPIQLQHLPAPRQ